MFSYTRINQAIHEAEKNMDVNKMFSYLKRGKSLGYRKFKVLQVARANTHFLDQSLHGFPGSSDGKGSACNTGDPGLIPGSGRSLVEGNGNPLHYPCFGEFHEQRSLVGYSPWGHKKWDRLSD